MNEVSIKELVYDLQEKLNLTHWNLRIKFNYMPDECGNGESVLARCNPVTDRYLADIIFSDVVFTMSKEEVVNTVVHELLHLHSNSAFMHMSDMISRCSTDLQTAITTVLRSDFEMMTDALTTAFCTAYFNSKE